MKLLAIDRQGAALANLEALRLERSSANALTVENVETVAKIEKVMFCVDFLWLPVGSLVCFDS